MKSLNLVIPVFNEEKRIDKTIETLKKGFSFSGLKLGKIIFVDDGSTDKTFSILKARQKELDRVLKTIEIISYPKNRGKGYAIKRGMLASDSDYTLFIDADISTPLNEFGKFIPFIKKGVPVVIGGRKNGQSRILKSQPLVRQFLGQGFTSLANSVLGTNISDFTCGFKLFSKKAGQAIFSKSIINGWGFDAETLFLAKRLGFEVVEVAVDWQDNGHSKVKLLRDLPLSLLELILIKVKHTNFRLSLPKKTSLSFKFICK